VKNLHDALGHSRILDLGPLPAPRLPPNTTVHQALPFIVRARRGGVVVVEGTHPVGIFTERDVVRLLADPARGSVEARQQTALRDVMSQPLRTARRQETLVQAIETMVKGHFRHLVVVDRHGDLKGLLITSDLVQYLTDHFPDETINLPPRLHQRFRRPEGA
jgi:CBS domain-containing protein